MATAGHDRHRALATIAFFEPRQIVDGFRSAKAPHANCARSYTALHGRDRLEALAIFEGAAAFVDASS